MNNYPMIKKPFVPVQLHHCDNCGISWVCRCKCHAEKCPDCRDKEEKENENNKKAGPKEDC